jgi:glycosyltransferase involved in cell wall biosynthesis/GT2 family glycosyltransferase
VGEGNGPSRLGVAISSFRRPDDLARCLDAVADLGHLIDAVCVVDDDPATTPMARPPSLPASVEFTALVQPENSGLPAVLERAFATLGTCDEILVLDDDTIVDESLVRAMRAALTPGVGAVSIPNRYELRYGRNVALLTWSPSLVRREAIRAAGPQDRALFFGYDDWDYSLRLADAGWPVAYLSHDMPRRSAHTPWPERRYLGVRNALWLATRRGRRHRVFWWVLAVDLGYTLRAALVALVRRRPDLARREVAAAARGFVHGAIGRMGPPPVGIMEGRGAVERAPSPFRGGPPLRTVEQRARRVIGATRVGVARAVGRVGGSAPVRRGDRLRIVADVHGFPPVTTAGSERSLAETLEFLAARGHAVRVLVPPDQAAAHGDGLDVRVDDPAVVREAYQWADVVCSQLTAYNRAARRASRHRRPIVAFLHHSALDARDYYGTPDLLVYCATWIAAQHPWPGRSVVLHPPIDGDRYRTAPGEHLTMINLSAEKGGALLVPLARRLPEHRFLAVSGAWGDQIIPPERPPNVRVAANTPDARVVYAQTRILLQPSLVEGYPRVVLEAAASGIPVVAHPADGTRAAMADAAIYVDRSDVDGWAEAIRRLDDPEEYATWSARARARFDEHDPAPELHAFETALLELARRSRPVGAARP